MSLHHGAQRRLFAYVLVLTCASLGYGEGVDEVRAIADSLVLAAQVPKEQAPAMPPVAPRTVAPKTVAPSNAATAKKTPAGADARERITPAGQRIAKPVPMDLATPPKSPDPPRPAAVNGPSTQATAPAPSSPPQDRTPLLSLLSRLANPGVPSPSSAARKDPLPPVIPGASKAAPTATPPGAQDQPAVSSVRPGLARPIAPNDQAARERRDAIALLQQAQATAKVGRLSDALRQARSAAQLFPDNPQIADYVRNLQERIAQNKQLSSASARAKAYLAAAVTRAQDLTAAGRFREAEDLLRGVVISIGLFKGDASVEIYRRAAERQLDRIRFLSGTTPLPIAQERPAPMGSTALTSPPPSTVLPVTSSVPMNLPRMQPEVASAPFWYTVYKSRLAFPMNVNYHEAPIAFVFEDIQQKTGLPFIIDEPVLRAQAHLNGRVDLRANGIPAEVILNLACLKAGVEYVPMERAVVITTPSKALDYLRALPEALRRNWLAARVIFPEVYPEYLAASPARSQPSGVLPDDRVPGYLLSGQALVETLRKLLPQP